MGGRWGLAAVVAATVALATAGNASAGVFATTDTGDSPEGLVTVGDSTFVSTTPVLPMVVTGSGKPSTIYRFDRRTGAELGRIVVEGEQQLGAVQGIAGMTADRQGRVLANDAQGRVLRFTQRPDGSFLQETYATVPDIPPCPLAAPGECSAHPLDQRPLVNEITRLRDGTLLLSDSFQAAVWKVAPGGGQAELLLTDQRLIGTAFGPNGIAASPNGRTAVLAVSSGPEGDGALYRFGVEKPALRRVARWDASQFPDGVQWTARRRLYVAMSTAKAVVMLDPWTGLERARWTDASFTAPAGIEVDETRGVALVANHDVDAVPPGPGTVSAVAIDRVRAR